ncbi:MAG: heavy metal translocating P-type ATPase, partial [Desulfobacterium sp.]
MILIKKTLSIKHDIPSRMRFKVYPVRNNIQKSLNLEDNAEEVTGIISAVVNPLSASLIVNYDVSVIDRETLIKTVKELFTTQSKPVKKPNDISVRSASYQFAGLSAVVGGLFIKEVILGVTVAQALFSPLGIITALFAGPLLKRGYEHLKERRFTLETFLGGSILVACAAGEAAAALEILWITAGGHLLQAWITKRSRTAIRDILQVTGKNTYILIDGIEVEIPVNEVIPGNIVVMHTGEKIAVDGSITEGEAIIDESPINGRSEPVARHCGDEVYAGTFVRQGVIHVKAEKVGDHTYLSRILTMVEDSLENRAPIEGVAEKLATNLIKAGFTVTFATLLLTGSLWRAFTVMLVMACPCATILSASTAISAAISAAAKRHILIKGGRYLEEVAQADIACFDKTGTLTTNHPEIRQFINVSDIPEDKLLQIAYSAEIHNFHPVALAIKAEAQRREIKPLTHAECNYILGKGVSAKLDNEEIFVGNHKLMQQFSINTELVKEQIEKFNKQGLTQVFIAKKNTILGLMGFANQDRPHAKQVVDTLLKNGIKNVVMITGDEESTARHLSKELNITKYFASVMPEDKAGIVTSLRNGGNKVLMVGDGINDALALAEADIGIAMGAGGSEVAIEAADIALVRDDLTGLIYVRALSRETLKVVHQNFWIATGSNVVGVALGALGILSPVAAGLIHIVHTVGILANSSRLLIYKEPEFE